MSGHVGGCLSDPAGLSTLRKTLLFLLRQFGGGVSLELSPIIVCNDNPESLCLGISDHHEVANSNAKKRDRQGMTTMFVLESLLSSLELVKCMTCRPKE